MLRVVAVAVAVEALFFVFHLCGGSGGVTRTLPLHLRVLTPCRAVIACFVGFCRALFDVE